MSLLDLSDIRFSYDRRRTTLDHVSLSVTAGHSVGLVGESGSGKSTILRLMLGLARQQAGEIRFEGATLNPSDRAFMRQYRRSVQAVFQDPYSSLDPRQKIRSIIAEPLRSLAIPGDHDAILAEALEDVGLPADAGGRYPHEFSGGQRQRIAIARAIAARPKLLLADEAVSALDLSTRILIVELFRKLAERMTLVFVSHDLGVVAALCEEMVILEKGRVVEAGLTKEIIRNPQHAYTRRLLDSIPRMPQ
ncbi:ATP-binding cassette domain-containing protein [Martelella sp. HB161492]|uniref:ABC transporter ATP-binding protein n=1 Tax=Martelella sp. HB161492 TaxID=2720726 RepID=UPI0015914521|nr:ATP-binding cassette domain-containing protein [Martelella sp. HB161492]